jgi:hypothetical protein
LIARLNFGWGLLDHASLCLPFVAGFEGLEMTLELSPNNTTALRDVEPWMFEHARKRPGMYTIRVNVPWTWWWTSYTPTTGNYVPDDGQVCVNLTGQEFAKLDKVIMNQTYAESKSKVMAAIVYQHASVIWPSHSPDDVTMRTLGAWAITQYRTNGNWTHEEPWGLSFLGAICPILRWEKKVVHLELIGLGPGNKPDETTGGILPGGGSGSDEGLAGGLSAESQPAEVPRNSLGYVVPGSGNDDHHPLGSVDADDASIRAGREDRMLKNDAGVGIIGQTTVPTNKKQIVGVASLPFSVNPNVYAREFDNILSAKRNRIDLKQIPFTATKEDKALLGRVVHAAIGDNPRVAVFSTRRITDWWQTHLFADLKSGKWTEERLSKAIENLCTRIDPQYRLSCDIKLEPMPEGKAPRMLIADGDEGQVLALLTVCCIEDLIKSHLPKKTIKGMNKRSAISRVCSELRVPKAAYGKTKQSKKDLSYGASVFEGDGTAWDTTCGAELRACVENPVILKVSTVLKAFMSEPASWVDAHYNVSTIDKLALSFKKNGEFRKITVDAIRRSGHRGTSCLNWWVNFTCWHATIFEMPEKFLDPEVRYGVDRTGVTRWLASAFEGDDSILSTTPKIAENGELYVSIIQMWTRLGFNMKIFLQDKRALFTGYFLALDNDGPTQGFIPEVDRCFERAGISNSAAMIKFFNDGDRQGCLSIAKAAALARAYEFAGLSPTISTKFLRYYESLDVKTTVDRDLVMRTCGSDNEFSEPELISNINFMNGSDDYGDEQERLAVLGFPCSQDELTQFTLRIWDYDLLHDWEGFRASLPASWRK